MIKFGNYLIWMNKEYRYIRNSDGPFTLLCEQVEEVANGFAKDDFNRYTKTVSKSEIQSVCNITVYCRFSREEFQIIGSKSGRLLLATDNQRLANSLGFVIKGKGEYMKWIEGSEAQEIREERTPLYGFE